MHIKPSGISVNMSPLFPAITVIKKRRVLLGKTQKDLATLSGVSQSLIAKIEAGRVDPSYSVATQIFGVLERLESKHAEIIGNELVAQDIVAKPVISVLPSDMIQRASEIMIKKNISQLPVLDEKGSNVGSVTEHLLVARDSGDGTKEPRVADIMGEPFPVISLKTRLSTIRNILVEEPAVLVSDNKTSAIIGIITKYDLIKAQRR